MKKYILWILPLLFLIACAPKLEKEVQETHSDGSPRLVVYYQMNDGFKDKVKVEAFYEDATLRYTGEFADDKRSGHWVYWYENGVKWSDGYFKNDLRDGFGTTWHKNGQINYEGAYTDGVRSGIWKFYDTDGNPVKEINYDEDE